MRHPVQKRKGVLLLVVLSLLALFVLVGTTFLVISGQYRRVSTSVVSVERGNDSPAQLVDTGVLHLIRDTNIASSPIRYHSLLRDLYGDENAQIGQVKSVGASPMSPADAAPEDVIVLKTESAFNSIYNDYYTGCVLTMTSGPLKNQSTRILRYFTSGYPGESAGTDKVFIIERFEGKVDVPQAGDSFLVNGRPLNGLGAGYDMTTGVLQPDVLHRPNYSGAGVDPTAGGMDEGYDAPDQNNVFLAWQPANVSSSADVIPSFHRPAAANFLAYQRGETPETVDINAFVKVDRDQWRSVILRPTKLDHPYFTGSNPQGQVHPFGFNPVYGPWDVDNDGDGVADSVWLDLGMPTAQTPDGRRYKPLFAILCLDLDGRVNVNTAGSLETLASGHFSTNVSYGATLNLTGYVDAAGNPARLAGIPLNPGTMGGGMAPITVPGTDMVPRGHGVGPAEISLYPLPLTSAQVEELVKGRYYSAPTIASADEYGMPGYHGFGSSLPPGVDPDDDMRFFLSGKNDDLPLRTRNSVDLEMDPGGPGFPARGPVDAHGIGFVGLTTDGQPLIALDPIHTTLSFDVDGSTYNFALGENDPYEFNPLSPHASDHPYSVSDLEPLLRMADLDAAGRGSRIRDIAGTVASDIRSLITTHSVEVPVPQFQYPPSRRAGQVPPATVFDFYEFMMGGTPLTATQIDFLIPPELQRGERFNVNREFDPNEWAQPTAVFPTRQDYARHLYLLAMLLRDYGTPGPPPNNSTTQQLARVTAQWAINVVDFRDDDAVMTPFVYDRYPFDGWDPTLVNPNDLSPPSGPMDDRQIVWGCERPELLLTETLAWHDRRSEDLAFPGNELVQPAGNDPSFDQKFLPQGSLFIELYNPWTSPTLQKPSELYGTAGVKLDDYWRIRICPLAVDPDDPTGHPDPYRDIYPYRQSVSGVPPTIAGEYRPSASAAPQELPPGGFAVIGTYEFTQGSQWITPIGFTDAAPFPPDDTPPTIPADIGNTRSIVLNSASGNLLRENGHDTAVMNPLLDVPNGVANPNVLVVGISRLSISEPRITASGDTYDIASTGSQLKGKPGGTSIEYLTPPLDQPLDTSRPDLDPNHPDLLADTQTIPSFRVAYLQRLADPGRPHDSNTNPYITVDSMPIDLTVFNGVTTAADPADSNDRPARDAANLAGNPMAKQIWFYSRQRGDEFFVVQQGGNVISTQFPYRTLWTQQPSTVPIDDPDHPENSNTRFPFSTKRETQLGSAPPSTHRFEFALRASLGSLGHRYMPVAGTPPEWDPNNTGRMEPCFPWLTWGDRPFHSAHELMLVPKTSAEDLLANFAFMTRDFERSAGVGAYSFYQPPPVYSLYNPPGDGMFGGTPGGGGGGSTPPAPVEFRPMEHLYNWYFGTDSLDAIFDFLQTPPRFQGTEKWFTDSQFATAEALDLYSDPVTPSRVNHYASRFRNPGKININTINDPRVWQAIAAGAPAGPTWDQIRDSMRVSTLDPTIPAWFFNPFRPAAGADLLANAMGTVGWSSESSFLRRFSAASQEPLFAMDLQQPYQESYRNPYFYLRPTTRLSNLVTTQSNVFAVWVTVGYFEVQPWREDTDGTYHPNGTPTVNVAHPDGLMLGQELGSDTGEIRRHRAFYIIDRSIPVGFQPGEDHNVEDTILLKRYIE